MPDPSSHPDSSQPDSSQSESAPETMLYLSSDEIVQILDEYLAALQRNEAPSRQALLDRHPQYAEQLEACLAGIDFIHRPGDVGRFDARLGDFRIIREVGRGGMGAVYEAQQISLGRRVALKVLRFAAIPDQAAVRRFQREAETVATLHHTNIVPIFYVGSERGINYYAMQFIEGRDLAELLAAEPSPPAVQRVSQWALQAAEALAHAHLRGVIHRDVKPSNLILDHDDRLWLTDFGLARRIDDVTLSRTGMLLGTPRYMSPEQAEASTKRVDHRSDLFSLGATLYELLTGQPAFSGGSSNEVIREILTSEPRPIRKLNPAVPRDLETIVIKCLAKEPDARYRSAEDLAYDLRAQVDGRPIRARRTHPVELAGRWLKQNRQTVSHIASATAITLLAVFLVGAAIMLRGRWNRTEVRLDAVNPPLVAELFGDDGDWVTTETLPLQRPIDLPADDYQIRVSAAGDLSQSVSLDLERGHRDVRYSVNLNDHWLIPPQRFESGFDVVELEDDRGLVFWNRSGVRLQRIRRPEVGWQLDLTDAGSSPRAEYPGFAWPGVPPNAFISNPDHHQEGRPWVVEQRIDADGDGVGDLIMANPNQAWLLAISGAGKGVIWFAGRGQDLNSPSPTGSNYRPAVANSAVLYRPLVVDDQDGDGVGELVIVCADLESEKLPQAGRFACRRWVEAVSGSSGKTLWRYELDDQWFATADEEQVPQAFRWVPDKDRGRIARVGMRYAFGPRVYRSPDYVELTGPYAYVPDRPRVVRLGDRETLAFIVGRHLVLLDSADGKPQEEPIDLGIRPGLPVRWGDTDGDGVEDLVLVEETANARVPGDPIPKLSVWSIRYRREMWSVSLDAYWPRPRSWLSGIPDWPQLFDVEGDGVFDILAPDGRSHNAAAFTGGPFPQTTPTGSLTLFDGETGRSRWSRRWVTLDTEVAYFAGGPDIDGDGKRDLLVTTLVSDRAADSNTALYVDAVSGDGGGTLWTATRSLADDDDGLHDHQLSPPFWWHFGNDGWQQLVVPVTRGRGGRRESQFCCFSAGTGDLTHWGTGIASVTPVDLDADGVEELLVEAMDGADGAATGRTVRCIRGVARQPWKRLGDLGEPIADLDNDGVRDLIRSWGDGTILATNGVTGREMWRSRPLATTSQWDIRSVSDPRRDPWEIRHDGRDDAGVTETIGDIDGDGFADLLIVPTHLSNRRSPPLHCLSGQDGRRLWSISDVTFREIDGVVALRQADLDDDGIPELLLIAAGDWPAAGSTDAGSTDDTARLWLFVVSSREGRLRWSIPLSDRYPSTGGSAVPMQFDICDLEIVVADLTGDRVADLLVPFVDAEGGLTQLAVSGIDGREIWRRERPLDGLATQSLENWTAPRLCDFDGDSVAELVLIEPHPVAGTGAISRVDVAITAVRASDGHELWSRVTDANFTHFSSYSRFKGALLRPQVVRTKDGGERVAVLLPGSDPKIVLLDGSGEFVERKLSFATDFDPLWVIGRGDEGDGNAIAFLDGSTVYAVAPDDLGGQLWSHDFGGVGRHRLLGRSAGDSGAPETLLVVTDPTDNRVVALDTATGRPRWSCPGPIGRGADPTRYRLPNRVAAIGSPSGEPPYVYFRHGFVNVCRQGIPFVADVGVITRAAAVTTPPSDDPRWQRPLPWRSAYEQIDSTAVSYVGWGLWYAVTILLLPFGLAIGTFRSRSGGRRGWMGALALAVAISLSSLLGFGPSDGLDSGIASRFSLAVISAVPLLAIGLTLSWMYRRRYRTLLAWGTILLAVAAVMAGMGILVAIRESPLVGDERFDLTGWYEVFLPAFFLTSWLIVLAMLLQHVAIGVWGRFRS